jgi:BRCA1-associated protein
MFSLEAGMKIQEAGGVDAGEGGDLVVMPTNVAGKGKKKKK